jgi:signal transduction histidine kinase
MGWLNLRRPQVRDAAGAVIFGVLYFGGLAFAVTHGWLPSSDNLYRYWVAGIFTVAVLLGRERRPVITLLGVAVLFPVIYARDVTYLRVEVHVLPILLATYTVVAKGRLNAVVTLLIAEFGVIRLIFDWEGLKQLRYGSEYLFAINPEKVALAQLFTIGVVVLGRLGFRQREVAGQLLARNHELERLRSVETDQVVTAERTRIARELHDVVAHHISAVVIRAQAADRVADSRPAETREAVRWIAANGQATLAAMRQVVRVLRSVESTGNLEPQTTLAELPEIAERMAAVGLPVELRLPSAVPVLPAAVELATVRIIQEALTNVLVHAKATRALVQLSLVDDELRLEVHDDGSAKSPPTAPIRLLAAAAAAAPAPAPAAPGADRPTEQVLPVSAAALGGNGLIGMRERATSCGGTLSIGTSPLGGWLVSARLRTTLFGTVSEYGTREGAESA